MIGRMIASFRVWKATRRYEKRDFDGARALVQDAVKADSSLPLAEQYLGVIALKQGKLKEAEAHLLKAEGSGGDPFIISQASGALAVLRKRYEEGEKKFLEALEHFPVAFEVWYHVGLARLLSGREIEARAEFTRLMAREDEALFRRLGQLAGKGGRE